MLWKITTRQPILDQRGLEVWKSNGRVIFKDYGVEILKVESRNIAEIFI